MLLKLSEQELADVAGLTRSAVQQWEREGGTAPARKHQQKIAAKLKMTVAELVDGVPETAAVVPPGPRLTNRAIDLALAFDVAGKPLTSFERLRLFSRLIQVLETPNSPLNAPDTQHIDTPAPKTTV